MAKAVPFGQKEPAGHDAGVAVATSQKWRGGHSVQFDAPVARWYVPAAQGSGSATASPQK